MKEGRRKLHIGNTSAISVTIRQTTDSRKEMEDVCFSVLETDL